MTKTASRPVQNYGYLCLLFLVLAAGCSEKISGDSVPKSYDVLPNAPYAYLMLSQMGIDPVALQEHANATMPPLDQIFRTAEACGRPFSPIGIESYLREPQKWKAAILEESNGELHALVGSVMLDGEECAQVIGQSFEPNLVPLAEVSKLPIKNVWTTEHAGRIELKVGRGTITFDKLWHNFGLTKPFSEVVTTFHVVNQGKAPVRIESVVTHCGCTAVDFQPGQTLAPGEAIPLKVSLKTGEKTSRKQTLDVQFVEPRSNTSRVIPLALFANQFRVMSIVPERVQFGKVDPWAPPSDRTIRLTPTERDRFRVCQIEIDNLPIRHTLIPIGAADDGTANDGYALKVSLDASTVPVGRQQGVIKVWTTSRYRPFVEIPVACEVRPRVEPIPSVAAFGVVQIGTEKQQRIMLVARDDQPFKVELLHAPTDCPVAIATAANSVVCVVTAKFSRLGSFERRVVLEVSTESWSETLEVACVASVVGQR